MLLHHEAKKMVKLQICGKNSLVQIQMESSRDIPIIIQLKFTDLVHFFQRKMDSKKKSVKLGKLNNRINGQWLRWSFHDDWTIANKINGVSAESHVSAGLFQFSWTTFRPLEIRNIKLTSLIIHRDGLSDELNNEPDLNNAKF